jgi:hypothetical protein
MKALAIFCTVLTLAFTASTASAQVTTSQYDNLRSGATLTETVLAPQNVNAKQFGKLGAPFATGRSLGSPSFQGATHQGNAFPIPSLLFLIPRIPEISLAGPSISYAKEAQWK